MGLCRVHIGPFGAIWGCMSFIGSSWGHMGLCGVHMGLCGVHMGPFGAMWGCMGFMGSIWCHMGLCGVHMELFGAVWDCLVPYRISTST